MACPICDQKPINCDCTKTERRQFCEIQDLEAEIERLRLTDAERFVLAELRRSLADTDAVVANEQAAVIDGLLERTQ